MIERGCAVLKYGVNKEIPIRISTVESTWDGETTITAEISRYADPFEIFYSRNSSNTKIKEVIFNDPATIVIWDDGSKTVVKCQPGDVYSKELGLAMCISKKFLGNKGNFNEVFKKWIPND